MSPDKNKKEPFTMDAKEDKPPFYEETRKSVLSRAGEIQRMEFDSKTCLANHVAGFLGCSPSRISQMKSEGKIYEHLSPSGRLKMMFMDPSIFDHKIKEISRAAVPDVFLVPSSAFSSFLMDGEGASLKTWKVKLGGRRVKISVGKERSLSEGELLLVCAVSTIARSLARAGIDLAETPFPLRDVFDVMKIKPGASVELQGEEIPISLAELVRKNLGGSPSMPEITWSPEGDPTERRLGAVSFEIKKGKIFLESPSLFDLEDVTYGRHLKIPWSLLFGRRRTLDEAMVRFEVLRRIFLTEATHGKIPPGIVWEWWESKSSCPPGGRWVVQAFEDAERAGVIQDVRWSLREASKNKRKSFVKWALPDHRE